MYYWIFGHFLLNALPVILYISLRQSPAARTPVLLLQGLQSSAARTAVLGCKDCGPRLQGLWTNQKGCKEARRDAICYPCSPAGS